MTRVETRTRRWTEDPRGGGATHRRSLPRDDAGEPGGSDAA
jgi:hypothetical protein